MTRSCLFLLHFFLPLFLSGCQTPAIEGEAVSYGQGSFRSSFLPKFSIGETGTHEFQVSGLQSRSFPHKVRIHSRWGGRGAEYRPNSFDRARLKVEVLDDSSRRVLASKVFRLNTVRYVNDGAHDQFFWGPKEPKLDFRKSYRVRITVITPSSRRFDEAQIMLR
ncbi:MAG: hypothetical protein P1U58_01680 [Verrucomicrobiales bacterium]|nr:hypothetical protein [Verrucomicrobiales bacterium]